MMHVQSLIPAIRICDSKKQQRGHWRGQFGMGRVAQQHTLRVLCFQSQNYPWDRLWFKFLPPPGMTMTSLTFV